MENSPEAERTAACRRSVKELTEFVAAVQSSVRSEDADPKLMSAFLYKIQEIVSHVPAEMLQQKTSGAGNVLFALDPETTQWATAGVTPEERPLWEALNITPDMAAEWKQANLGVDVAVRWKYARPYYFKMDSIDPAQVREWEKTSVPTEKAVAWMSSDIAPSAAQEWIALGGTLEEGRLWLNEFRNETTANVYAASKSKLGLPDLRKYTDRGITLSDAPIFASKGHTPLAASKLVTKGVTATNSKNKTGNEPVPGKAWLKIKKAADETGWTVLSVDEIATRRGRRPAKEIRVVFAKATSQHGNVTIYFEGTRMLRATKLARAYWSVQATTITAVVNEYLT